MTTETYPIIGVDHLTTETYPIIGVDHLEFFVGNAKQAAYFYVRCLGFDIVAYQGLETGERKITSYVLQQGDIRFVLTSSLDMEHPVSKSVLKHGDTIHCVALEVPDAEFAYQVAVANGAIGLIPPTRQDDEHGTLRFAAVRAYGDTCVKFVDRSQYGANFMPGYEARQPQGSRSVGLLRVDHIVGNVERGQMDRWVNFFAKTMGFEMRMHFDERTISTEYSALMSKVLQNGDKTIININEPADGRKKSQIDEYLDFHNGPGVQHLGLLTDNIVETVLKLRENGVEFLPIPLTYYEDLGEWVNDIDVPVEKLAELGILVDRDEDGYLLQLFTKPVSDRPTLFFEIIERHGSRGFGAGNFKSLFVALEREQERRGNL